MSKLQIKFDNRGDGTVQVQNTIKLSYDMELLNLPPFYVGQKVLFVGSKDALHLKHDIVYEVAACEYNFGNPTHPVGAVTKYWYVGIVGLHDGLAHLTPLIFVPLQQKEFSAMTFSEIVEAEQLEVLLNN